MTSRRVPGFGLVELLVALVISGALVMITTSTYSLFRKSVDLDRSRVEMAQNARIVGDRLSRELRITQDVVTTFPSNAADTSVAQPGEVEFQDGNANDLTYRRYYVVGTVLKLQVKEYKYPSGTAGAPTGRVTWNAPQINGALPQGIIISAQDIADGVQSLVFYGDEMLSMTLTTGNGSGQTYSLRMALLGRNSTIGKNP